MSYRGSDPPGALMTNNERRTSTLSFNAKPLSASDQATTLRANWRGEAPRRASCAVGGRRTRTPVGPER